MTEPFEVVELSLGSAGVKDDAIPGDGSICCLQGLLDFVAKS
jgi:hypothetical protein